MEHIGVLGPNTLAAHSIRTTEHDVEILAKHGASVAHCIASNTKAAKGVAPVSLMHKHGMSVGFGTDGPASGNTWICSSRCGCARTSTKMSSTIAARSRQRRSFPWRRLREQER